MTAVVAIWSYSYFVSHETAVVSQMGDEMHLEIPSEKGVAKGPYPLQEGMNIFLDEVGITYRRDEENHRPRANKEGSQMDQKQKEEGKYYYL